jgi:hypothetical protein
MGQAILAFSGSAAALLPRRFAVFGRALASLWHGMTRDAAGHYHPEQHYMRGPGPAWHAKHDNLPTA